MITQDINRCQTVARACALIYNWWSWYCRAAHPTGRREAITSRPLLLAAVGKAANHANQTTLYLTPLYLTPLHGRADVLKLLIAKIGHVRPESSVTIDRNERSLCPAIPRQRFSCPDCASKSG